MTATPSLFEREQVRPWSGIRPASFDVLRILLGLLLLTAAALKGWQLATEPTLEKGLLTSRWFLVMGVQVESLLAAWLLSGLHRSASRWVVLACFTIFAGIALHKTLSGEPTCGCFGKAQVKPLYTLLMDMLIIGMLLACRPAGEMRPQQPARSPSRGSRRRVLLALTAVAAAGLLPVVLPTPSPAGIDEAGRIAGNSRVVVLEPETWVGRPLPLLPHIDIADRLRRGPWILLFYHFDCPHCLEAMPRYVRISEDRSSQAGEPRVALVEVPPYDPQVHNQPAVQTGRLSDTRDWFMESPVAVALADGIVQAVLQGPAAASPDPLLAQVSTPSNPQRKEPRP